MVERRARSLSETAFARFSDSGAVMLPVTVTLLTRAVATTKHLHRLFEGGEDGKDVVGLMELTHLCGKRLNFSVN